METTNIIREIASLPPEAQQQVLDFMAFLKTRYPRASAARKTRRVRMPREPFIGMWRNRQDMHDSTVWVRDLRQREWERGR